jgi:hypothetical protein
MNLAWKHDRQGRRDAAKEGWPGRPVKPRRAG